VKSQTHVIIYDDEKLPQRNSVYANADFNLLRRNLLVSLQTLEPSWGRRGGSKRLTASRRRARRFGQGFVVAHRRGPGIHRCHSHSQMIRCRGRRTAASSCCHPAAHALRNPGDVDARWTQMLSVFRSLSVVVELIAGSWYVTLRRLPRRTLDCLTEFPYSSLFLLFFFNILLGFHAFAIVS